MARDSNKVCIFDDTKSSADADEIIGVLFYLFISVVEYYDRVNNDNRYALYIDIRCRSYDIVHNVAAYNIRADRGAEVNGSVIAIVSLNLQLCRLFVWVCEVWARLSVRLIPDYLRNPTVFTGIFKGYYNKSRAVAGKPCEAV